MTFKPLQSNVLVERSDAEEKSAGGIIIAANAREKPMEGKVIAVGPGITSNVTGQIIPMNVKAGDMVLFAKAAGTETKIDGVEYTIIREEEILGILN